MKKITKTLIDGKLIIVSLIIVDGNYGYIYANDSTCHGYYIVRFSSYQYTLQVDLSIDGQVISSGSMVCEKTNFSIYINSHYHVLQK